MRDMSEPAKLSARDAYEAVTNRILELLEKNVIPWQQPWRGGWPQNLFTKREYGFLNGLFLNVAGFGTPYWATQKQIEKHKGRIRADQATKCNTVFFFLPPRRFWINTIEFGSHEASALFLRLYAVWNVEQTEGLERYIPQPTQSVPVDEAEKLVKGMPQAPTIRGNPGMAYYHPRKDFVSLPSDTQFHSIEEYYATLFHELVHATGHPARLKRKSLAEMGKFGDPDYSQEELVAEMGAAMLCGVAGIAPKTVENSAAYIQFWLRELKNDKRLLLIAAGQAQKACDFIRGRINRVQSAQNNKYQKHSGGLPTNAQPQRMAA